MVSKPLGPVLLLEPAMMKTSFSIPPAPPFRPLPRRSLSTKMRLRAGVVRRFRFGSDRYLADPAIFICESGAARTAAAPRLAAGAANLDRDLPGGKGNAICVRA
jgi:hypothetical protein